VCDIIDFNAELSWQNIHSIQQVLGDVFWLHCRQLFISQSQNFVTQCMNV